MFSITIETSKRFGTYTETDKSGRKRILCIFTISVAFQNLTICEHPFRCTTALFLKQKATVL